VSKLELAGVVTVAYLALYAVAIVLLRRRNAVNRRVAAALPPDLEVDPFHALAVPTGKAAAMDQAALAALLHDGLITIDCAGLPPHPALDALTDDQRQLLAAADS
jgi:hypothetical protein